MTLSTSALETLERIDPYLFRIAHKLANTTWRQCDPDDLHQEMRLWFLEKWGQVEDCTVNKDGYYSQGAAWHARHWARDNYTRFHKGKRIAWADPLPEWWGEVYAG